MQYALADRRNLSLGLITVFVSLGVGYLCTLASGTIPFSLLATAEAIWVSMWLMQQSVGIFQLSRLSIAGFWYWLYLPFVVLPALSVYGGHGEPYRSTYLLAVDSALITVPAGVALSSVALRFQKQETRNHLLRAPVPVNPSREALFPAFLIFLGVAVVLSALYVLEVREIPLFHLVLHPGDYDQLVLLREESLKLLVSPLRYAYYVLRSTLYPMLILVALGRYLQGRKAVWLGLFITSLGTGGLFSLFSIAKSPLSTLIVMMAIFVYLYRGGRIRARSIFLTVPCVLAVPAGIIMLEQPDLVGLAGALQAIGSRVFYLPAEILYYYFEVFPRVVPFQHGATIGLLASALGMTPFDDTNFVGRYMYVHGMPSVTANAPFLGSLYADFGLLGVFFGGAIAGVLMQTMHVWLMRSRKDTLRLALLAFLFVTFAYLNATSLPIVLLSDGVLFAMAFVWIMRAASEAGERQRVC